MSDESTEHLEKDWLQSLKELSSAYKTSARYADVLVEAWEHPDGSMTPTAEELALKSQGIGTIMKATDDRLERWSERCRKAGLDFDSHQMDLAAKSLKLMMATQRMNGQ